MIAQVSTDLQPPSRIELIVANLVATFAAIPGVAGVVAEEPPPDGDAAYQSLELPRVWLFEDAPEEPIRWENRSRRFRQRFTAVCIYEAEESQVRAAGRRFAALLQTAIAGEPNRGLDRNGLQHAQETAEATTAIGTLPERNRGVVRVDFDVEYLRAVHSAFLRGDEVDQPADD